MDLEFLDVERGGDGTRSTISAHQAAQLALPASGVTVSANRKDFNETGLSGSSRGLHDTHYIPDYRQVANQFHELLLHDKPNALEKHRQQIDGKSKPTSSKYSTARVKSQVHEEFGDLLLEDFEVPLNKSAFTKSSSIMSEFEIVEDTDAEILTLQEDDFEENCTASEPLSHQLLQIADLLKSAAVTAQSLHATSVKHLPEGTRLTNNESSEALHAGCRQQVAALKESLHAECESKLAALRLQISDMSPTASCKNCQLTETRLREKCCRLERQLHVVSCDFQSANKKNKEYEDEISLLKDDCSHLRTLVQRLQRNASENMTWTSSAEHSSSKVAAAAISAERTAVDITKPISASAVINASVLSASNEAAVWSCPQCTFDNLGAQKFCEMCGVSR